VRPVVFDLDGTLVHSAPDIHAAVNRMLAAERLPPLDLPTVVSFVGRGMPVLVTRVMGARDIPGDQHPRLLRSLKAEYDAQPSALTRPYEGVVAALEVLRDRGHPMGVCTNKPEDSARAVIGALGLTRFFRSVVGGDRLAVPKPDPAMLHACVAELGGLGCLFVGDSEVDAATAKAAGVPFALFTRGYRAATAEELAPDEVFDDWGALPGIVARY
jgi:phosphoglycolate phosphatase